MELKYYILEIYFASQYVEIKKVLYILKNFTVLYATYKCGRYRAVCEDCAGLKSFFEYKDRIYGQKHDVCIGKEGRLDSLLSELRNEDGDVIYDNALE